MVEETEMEETEMEVQGQEEEEQEHEEGSRGGKGFMVERIRARQSATSLLGAQARAGVWPSSSTASTVAPRLSSAWTTVAIPLRAARCRGICSAALVALTRVALWISPRISRAHIS